MKKIFKKISKFSIIIFQIFLIILVSLSLVFLSQRNDEKKKEDNTPKLSKTLVSVEKDEDLEVYLDLKNGCKYYKNFGIKLKEDGVTYDCSDNYIEEYKNKIAKK